MKLDDIIDSILAENDKRWQKLRADYDPVTGEGLAELLGEKRVLLQIKDFAIPEQWVPEDMLQNKLVKEVAKAGSIERYIITKKWKYGAPDKLEIERRLRRIRHKYDFCFWAFFCIKIKAKKGGRIRFRLNYPQLEVLAKCEAMRRAGVSIDLIILKARQWGGSTFCFFYQVWLMFKWDEFHSFAIAAHATTASETILAMLKRTISEYPAWDLGLPDDTELRLAPMGTTGHAYVIKDQNNRQVLEGAIFIGTAEKPDTLRSKDIAGVHYSEVGIWPDTPEKRAEDLIADIQGGMIDSELSMQVMESTAKQSDDYFAHVWEECADGKGGYQRIFISFAKIIHDTKPIPDILEFVRWLYEHKDDDLPSDGWKDSGKYYWWLWKEVGATLEGINWYRYRRLKISFAKMCNEAPATPEQAFITAGQKVFDPFEVQRKKALCREPIFVGDLISDGKEGKAVLSNIAFIPNSSGALRVWDMPDDTPIKNRYVVAVDIGGPNETSDYSSVRVLDRLALMPEFDTSGIPAVVAEMHYHVDHDRLAYDALRLAEWYNHAKLVIESNTLETHSKDHPADEEGFEYILDIIAALYDNLYMREAKAEDVKQGVQRKWGFHTNVNTKPKIIDNMRICLRDDLWDEPSVLCLEEMANYIDDKGQYNAAAGKHDDVVMATAILLWVGMKEMPIPTWVKKQPKRKKVVSGDNLGLTNM